MYPIVLCTAHDMSPNRAGVAHVHRPYVADARKHKLEVSPDAAQTDAIRAPDDATQQSLELAIGRAGLGWAGPIVSRAKTGPGQNWPDFFGPKF